MKPTKRAYPIVPFLLVLVLSQFLASCKQSTNPGSEQPGTITGIVSLWDSGGPLPSSAGVSVVLENSNYSAQTDSTGRWEIENVAPGNYNITVSKAGFGLCRAFGFPVAGPGISSVGPSMTFGIAPLVAPVLSNFSVTSTRDSGQAVNELSGTVSNGNQNSNEAISPIFFIDLMPNVQPGDAHALWWQFQNGGNQFAIPVASLYHAGIPSGTTVYISASQVNFQSVWQPGGGISSGTYYDPIDNSTRLISPGPRSNVVAIKIP